MVTKTKLLPPQNPLIMRLHRVMEVFAKSDDERDFYLDRQEGFLFFADLDKSEEELDALEKELEGNPERYGLIPKLTFYEIKKLMEGFVNEKVYDIDTKEKLLDIISSKEARENFLEFICDHHAELERWQSYYQERFRIRIIEWLRQNKFDFVFEEDLEMTKSMVEKLKLNTFESRAGKDIQASRKVLQMKAKTYYSNEALNPRPKRGRPPKQVAKVETEPQFSSDIFVTVPKAVKPFLFLPEYEAGSSAFTISSKFGTEADLLAHRRRDFTSSQNAELQEVQQKLQALRSLSSTWNNGNSQKSKTIPALNGEPQELKKPVPAVRDEFESEMRPVIRRDRRDMKAEKAQEASFFESRKMKETGGKTKEKVEKKEAPKAGSKAATKSAPKFASKFAPKSASKFAPKARLRPLKKVASKPEVKAKAPQKAKAKVLRHLRRAKKK